MFNYNNTIRTYIVYFPMSIYFSCSFYIMDEENFITFRSDLKKFDRFYLKKKYKLISLSLSLLYY